MLENSRGGLKTPATPKMEFFVALIDGWRPQTNGTKSFILDVAMDLGTALWNNYHNELKTLRSQRL